MNHHRVEPEEPEASVFWLVLLVFFVIWWVIAI